MEKILVNISSYNTVEWERGRSSREHNVTMGQGVRKKKCWTASCKRWCGRKWKLYLTQWVPVDLFMDGDNGKLFNSLRFSISDFDISKDFCHRIAFYSRLAEIRINCFSIWSAIHMTRHILAECIKNETKLSFYERENLFIWNCLQSFFVKVTFPS